MQQLNTIFKQLSQGWEYYYGTMINFSEAHPIIAPIVFLVIIAASIYSIILSLKISSTKKQKPLREVFDLKYKYENPSPIAKALESIILPIFTLPIYLLEKTLIVAIKITAYLITIIMLQVMKIRFK